MKLQGAKHYVTCMQKVVLPKLIELDWACRKKFTNAITLKVLRRHHNSNHNFQTSLAVHGADQIKTPNFQSEVNSMSVFGFKLILLLTAAGLSSQPCSINFSFGRYSHKLTLGMLCECQMTRRFVTKILPRSPALPFVSSIESSLSIKISPGRIFICLAREEHLVIQFW